MNEVITIGGVDCYEKDGVAYLKLETVARGLGFSRVAASGNEVVRWETVRKYLEELGVPTSWHGDSPQVGKDGLPEFIPENLFYRLAMKAKNETAEKFQALVADEIIPSIRKTGCYGTRQAPLSIEDAFRLMEIVGSTPEGRMPILRAVFSQAGVHIPETVSHGDNIRKAYSSTKNHVNDFLQGVNVINRSTNDVYQEYVRYCSEHGISPVSNIVFSKMVNGVLGTKVVQKKINGVNRKMFVRG